MAQSSKKSNSGFWYMLNADGTITFGFGRNTYGRIVAPYMQQLEETIEFIRGIEEVYLDYHKAVVGNNR